jgi:hypothetical protein
MKAAWSRMSRTLWTTGIGAFVWPGLALVVVAGSSCSGGDKPGGDVDEKVSALVSAASLQMKVLTNSCGASQVQDFFQVTNTGGVAIKLSDIKIKLWADDTSGQTLVPHISTGGCASGANGSPSCVHQVTGVSATATPFSPACGPDANHQANWEITLSDSDSATLPPGATWNNIQTSANLANFSNFKPGTGKWFSPCLAGSSFVSDAHFALYYQGTLVFSNGLPAPDCRAPHGTQTITSYTPPPVSPVVGPAPASQVISLAVGLPVNNLAQLQSFANQASDPTSPGYRKYLSSADLIATYSPSVPSYNQLVAWAQGRGFTKVGTFPNRLMIAVTATVAQIEAAFHANVILATRPDGTPFYRLDRQPSVDLTLPLLGVSGLDNYILPRPSAGTAPISGDYQSSDLRSAYFGDPACATLDGTGQTIGIFSVGAGFDPNDLSIYKSKTNLTGGPAVRILSGDDPTNASPTPIVPTGNRETVELGLDVEAATAIAPQAQVIVFEGTNTDSNLALIASNAGISQISSSFLFVPTSLTPTTFTVMAAQGQSFITGSGDFGSFQPPTKPTATCPAASLAVPGTIVGLDEVPADVRTLPYLTVAGGTFLATDANQKNATETVWGADPFGGAGIGSGGGLLGIPIPPYQLGSNPSNAEVSTTVRNLPDVAMLADSMYVVETVCQAPGHNGVTGSIDPGTKLPVPATCPAGSLARGLDAPVTGTSIAAPMWAGVMALVNQQGKAMGQGPVGFANPTIYQIGKDLPRYVASFFDVVSGTPTNLCGFHYTATMGYDLTTGWGSPRCGLLAAINGAPPTITVGVSRAAKGGPLICVNGKGFTSKGSVTVQYAGVPELADPTKPFNVATTPLDIITTTQAVDTDGTFHEADNEVSKVGTAVAAGIPACASAAASGVVSINVIDNTTGISATSTIPTNFFCEVDQSAPFAVGPGCEISPAQTPLVISAGGAAPGFASFGPDVCISGSGFTPMGAVDLEYVGVPLPGFVPQILVKKGTADATGKVSFSDGSFQIFGDGVACTTDQAFSRVSVIAFDETTGNNTSDTLDAALWCSVNFNPPDSGDLSGCGL